MKVTDEELMALVDGECTPADRASLESRIATDPELARRYAAQRRLRERLAECFDPILNEPIPQRLLDAVSATSVRGTRPLWLAVAASLVVGLVLGPVLLKQAVAPRQAAQGSGVAGIDEALARVLSSQLAADQTTSAALRVGISFVSKGGTYCRTFTDAREARALAGLACRVADRWRLEVVEPVANETPAPGAYSPASSAIPPQVLRAAEALIDGAPLDATAEAAARSHGWEASARSGSAH